MLKRLLTGIVYMLVLIAFFLLKIYVHILCFDLLVVIFTVCGTIEMLRAFGDKIHISQKIIVGIFAPLVIICFAVSDEIFKLVATPPVADPDLGYIPNTNYSAHLTFVVFIAAVALLFGMIVFAHEKVSLESTGYAMLSLLYPSVFLLVLSGCNHMPEYSDISVIYVFAICPIADSFAYVFGRLFGKKVPAKLAPNVSPNKTLIGGFGGLIGGALGAAAIFFAYYGIFGNMNFQWVNLIFFISLGILTAAFAEFGDLVESAIKRKLGIKDMGKCLPGHGGVLDRIDSSLYASLIVCLVCVARIMLTRWIA